MDASLAELASLTSSDSEEENVKTKCDLENAVVRVCVLKYGKEYDYTIPSFSVVTKVESF